MKKNKLLATIDFSNITPSVIHNATRLAQVLNLDLSLIHVKHLKSDADIEEKLSELATSISQNSELTCDYILVMGSVFSEIARESKNLQYKLTLVGTHGFKGFRERMFGADILKLIKTIYTPVISIQKGCDFTVNKFQNILLPVASHQAFDQLIKVTICLAKAFDSTIYIYSIKKPELEWSKQLLDNIELAKNTFDKEKVKYIRVNEIQTSFSFGYAKQTLQYALKIDAHLIAMMASPTKEHLYFADGDKELLLTNDALIPVLSF